MNRNEIKNPHWIYPGDVVVFLPARPTASAARSRRSSCSSARRCACRRPIRVDAARRRRDLQHPAGRHRAVPVAAARHRSRRPRRTPREIVAGRDERVVRGEGDVVYVGRHRTRRPGDALAHLPPGREATSRSTIRTSCWATSSATSARPRSSASAEVSTVRIATAREEILVGDRLVPAPREQIVNYVPHAPDRPIAGRILRLAARCASRPGRGMLVTLDKGTERRHRRRHGARDRARRSADPRPARVDVQPDPVLRFLGAIYRHRRSRPSASACCSCSASSTTCPTRSCSTPPIPSSPAITSAIPEPPEPVGRSAVPR